MLLDNPSGLQRLIFLSTSYTHNCLRKAIIVFETDNPIEKKIQQYFNLQFVFISNFQPILCLLAICVYYLVNYHAYFHVPTGVFISLL